ncbi:MAG: FAD-dependent oxidoreductase [Deltaproteobacteria bacterium]|nr:FAD-dependent oxidoreductase [Deltaproteobacteria bacterium]
MYFAGEHTNSFYEFQGFMEGAVLSGIRAAREILQDIKVGALRVTMKPESRPNRHFLPG